MTNVLAILFITMACVTGWNPETKTYNVDENGYVAVTARY